MKTSRHKILFALLLSTVLAGSAFAAPQGPFKRVERRPVQRPSRHPNPHGQRQQKGMRHTIAERGRTYTLVNGCAVPVPVSVVYTTPTPVYVGPTVVTTTYPAQQTVYLPAYWNYYAPPPPNPRPAIVYTPCIRPGVQFNLSF